MRDVAVIGIGMTKFGELWDKSLRDLGIEAGLEAIVDSGISGKDIDAVYIGNMSASRFVEQGHIASVIVDYVGLANDNIEATRIEAAGASGGLALRQAYISIASGIHDIVVVGGAEKMTDVSESDAVETLATSVDQEWESFFGATLTSLYAMIARKHMHDFGTTKEQMASVAVKNHFNGSLNPKAQFQKEIKLDTVMKSPMVSDPLGVFDCAPTSDGAAALVLCDLKKAKKICEKPIKISASAQASDTIALHDRKNICSMDATVIASNKAFKLAGLKRSDIDFAEVHDNFSISEILAIEDLGFVKKGDGGRLTESGFTALNSEISINPSGGLKARGQPIGAVGISQAVEIVEQLRNEAGKRQVKNAKRGLMQNIGGTGSTAVVNIFEVI